MSLTKKKTAASVPEPYVMLDLNTSATLSCESDAQPLSSCTWARSMNDSREIIMIDQDGIVGQDDGETTLGGISYVEPDGLNDGKCKVRIESMVEEDSGLWECTLVSERGEIFTGEVNVKRKFKRTL